MTNVILASGRGVPSTKNRIVIRCRVAGPNEVSIHEEGGTAERRNWGFLGEITNVGMMTSATSRKPADCSREILPLAGLVEHQTPGRPKARPKRKGQPRMLLGPTIVDPGGWRRAHACALARRLAARSGKRDREDGEANEADRRDGDRTQLSPRRGHGPRRRRTADRRPIPATISKAWMVGPCRETALLPALLVSRQGDRWSNRLARHLGKANSLAARQSLGVASVGSRTITELGR